MIIPQKHTNTFLFCAVVAFFHFITGLVGILNHEIWSDEAHHFLLARDSSSLTELYKNAAYDGHPLLWDGLLFLITRFSSSVIYMQLLNISIMSGTVFLFLKHAPFKKVFSALIVFGCFFIYEYHIISRNYAISVFFITLVFIQLNKPVKDHLSIAMCLLALSFTHIYSILIVITLCLVLIFTNKNTGVKCVYLALLVIGTLILFSLKVPADHILFKYDIDPLLSFKRFGKAFSIYLKGILPLPDFTSSKVWNSNLIIAWSKPFAVVLSFVFALAPFFIFKKERFVLFFFYFSTVFICVFIYVSPIIVATRHAGFIFVILIFSFWLRNILYPTEGEKNKVYQKIAIVVLALHVVSGFYLFVTDVKRPFSNSKNAAIYLQKNNLQNKVILLSNLSSGPAVSAYLNKKIMYLETGVNSSFCTWNTWPFILTKPNFERKLQRLAKNDTSVLLVNTFYLKKNLGNSIDSLPGFKILKLTTFDDAMVDVENYNVYYLIKNN
ncbi:MAG: hypothetical protein JNJ41_01395 [Bacteroidia bacterium]|nr:hypothetical protein [Bacteroidia bacterium]